MIWFFKKKIDPFPGPVGCAPLKHGKPGSSSKLPDQKLNSKFFLDFFLP
jgi:hypothetical protein